MATAVPAVEANRVRKRAKRLLVLAVVLSAACLVLGVGWWATTKPAKPMKSTHSPVAAVAGAPSEEQLLDPKVMAAYITAKNPKVFPKLADMIVENAFKAAKQYDVSVLYVVALMGVESSFDHTEVSNKSCIGLMQINPKVWLHDQGNELNLRRAGVLQHSKQLFDPAYNIQAGVYILKHYIVQGKDKGVDNPVEYGVNKYLGDTAHKPATSHFQKMCAELGQYYVFAAHAAKQSVDSPPPQTAEAGNLPRIRKGRG